MERRKNLNDKFGFVKIMEYTSIGESCSVVSGGTPSRSKNEYWENGTIPWIKIGNIKSKYVNEYDELITEQGLNNSSAKLLKKGTILYTIFATLGEVGILDTEACTNQAIAGINIIDPRITTDYLYYYLKSKKDYVNNMGRGVAQNNINLTTLKNFEIPLIDVDKQLNIVEILEKVERMICLKEKEIDDLDLLIKARFIEMFGDLRINNKNWQVVSFNECASIDTNMIRDFEGYEDYPHIGIDSIEKDTGRIFGYRTISEDRVVSGKYLFTPRHIIYSKIRPNLNKVALPEFTGLCSADAYPILVKDTVCTREFLGYTLRSRIFLDYILAFSNRTNLPKVNKSQVEGFKLPLPPIDLQNQFADFVRQVDKSREEVKKSLENTQQLYDSLMQEYFG